MKHIGVSKASFFWVLQGICTLHKKPYSPEIAQQQLAAPYSSESLADAIASFGFKVDMVSAKAGKLHKESFPLVLRAPQDGVIKDLATTTTGAVVQPGAVVLTLVPKDELLFADVNIKNEDMGFVAVGQSIVDPEFETMV